MSEKQTILITGATGNIGGGSAVALARRGARVVLLGRENETLEAAIGIPLTRGTADAVPRFTDQVGRVSSLDGRPTG